MPNDQQTSTFDPDNFMKSRGPAAAAAPGFDPDNFMQTRKPPMTEQQRTGFHTAPNIAPMKSQQETQFEMDREPGAKVGVWGGIKSMLPGLFAPKSPTSTLAEPAQTGAGKYIPRFSSTGPVADMMSEARNAEPQKPSAQVNPEWSIADTLRHGYQAGRSLPGGKLPVVGPVLGAGTAAAYAAGKPVAGVDPQEQERSADVGDAGSIVGRSIPTVAAAVGTELAANAKPIAGKVQDFMHPPEERAVQKYQKIIAPTSSPAIEQLDDVETMKRAAPHLAEQERLTPVKAEQQQFPRKIGEPVDPQAGQKLGVMNYRQNAEAAVDRLMNDRLPKITEPYKNAPIDKDTVVKGIRGTVNPHSPTDSVRSEAVENLAKFYDHDMTVDEGMKKIAALNEDRGVQAYHKALPDRQVELLKADPALEAKVKAADHLRDAVFDSIEKHGSPEEGNYVRETRKDVAALKQVSQNLAKPSVPTPGSFSDKLVNTVRSMWHPYTYGAETLFGRDPAALAQQSSELLGRSKLVPRDMPAARPTPWKATPPSNEGFELGAQAPFAELNRRGHTGDNGMWANPGSIWHVQPSEPHMWGEPGPKIGPSVPPITAAAPTATEGMRAANPENWPGGRPPQVGDIGRVEDTRGAQPPQETSNTILPGRSGTSIGGLLPENRVVPSTTPPPVPEQFRSEYVGPTDFNERSLLGARGEGGVRGPVTIHRPGPVPTEPRGVYKPALNGPIGEVPRGTNGPDEIFGGNRGAELSAVEPEIQAREERRAERTQGLMRDSAKAFESQPNSKVPEITPAKPTGDVGSIADREKKTGTANDRPQYQYKPSEKAATMSEKPKDLGKEFRTDQLTHEVTRNQAILDNPEATAEEKSAAKNFFEEHPDRRLDKTGGGATAAERNAARNGGTDQGYTVKEEGGAKWAVDPSGKYRISIKGHETPERVRGLLADQEKAQKGFTFGAPEPLSAEDKAAAAKAKEGKGTAGPKTEFKTGENLVGAAHKTAVLRDASGREIGDALLSDTGENGKRGMKVSVSQIEAESRGKGLGKQMYNDIINHAKEQGYDYVESDKKRTADANHVWEALKKEGHPVRTEKGRYILDLKKHPAEDF